MDNRGRKPDTWTLRRGFTISGNTFDFACHGPRPLKEGEEIVVVMLSEYLDLHAQRGAVSDDSERERRNALALDIESSIRREWPRLRTMHWPDATLIDAIQRALRDQRGAV